MSEKINANPTVFHTQETESRRYELTEETSPSTSSNDKNRREEIDGEEIFDLIRAIRDPEHPLSLEELNVVQKDLITVGDADNKIEVIFVPTVPHCSMSTLIGLCIRVKLLRALPPRFKVDIRVKPGSHASEDQVNKQLNDKERVAAALENTSLLQAVNRCLELDTA